MTAFLIEHQSCSVGKKLNRAWTANLPAYKLQKPSKTAPGCGAILAAVRFAELYSYHLRSSATSARSKKSTEVFDLSHARLDFRTRAEVCHYNWDFSDS